MAGEQYSTVQYSTVQWLASSTVQYSTVQWLASSHMWRQELATGDVLEQHPDPCCATLQYSFVLLCYTFPNAVVFMRTRNQKSINFSDIANHRLFPHFPRYLVLVLVCIWRTLPRICIYSTVHHHHHHNQHAALQLRIHGHCTGGRLLRI